MLKIKAIIKGIAEAASAERKENRIMRQVDQAIDMAKDQAESFQEKADELLDHLPDYSNADQTEELSKLLNKYKDHILSKRKWEECAEIFTSLKQTLSTEVPEE